MSNQQGSFGLIIFFFSCVFFCACSKSNQPFSCVVNGIDTCASSNNLKMLISTAEEQQTIHSFGASDCWSIKFIGKHWPDNKKNKIADLLFSKNLDAQGNPLGIGLSMWRMNIGAGSFEQGGESKIISPWRREECFQNAAGEFNWDKQSGNQWFAKAAKLRGVEKMLAFTLSPPVHMTKNGLAFGSSGADLGKINISQQKYAEYAEFVATVLNRLSLKGINFDYFSPLNEPQWDWVAGASGEAGQEGTSATNAEAFSLLSELDNSFIRNNVSTKIAFGETAALSHLSAYAPWLADRSDVFSYYWDRSSVGYLGNLSTVEKIISGHSYFSQPDLASLINNRLQLKAKMLAVNNEIKFWQSEYCILLNEDGTQGNGRDLGIQSALYIARVIHHDLTLANASSWQWWLGVSPSDYKDGLVYVTDLNSQMGELPSTINDGLVLESKMLWAMGNFSRFIRPGSIRVSASIKEMNDQLTSAKNIMLSAYKNLSDRQLIVVIINMAETHSKIELPEIPGVSDKYKRYTTSASKNLSFSAGATSMPVDIEPKSISTLVFDL